MYNGHIRIASDYTVNLLKFSIAVRLHFRRSLVSGVHSFSFPEIKPRLAQAENLNYRLGKTNSRHGMLN